MQINTGYGYYIKEGRKISKYVLKPGYHPNLPSGIDFVEVESHADLEAVVLDPDPMVIQMVQESEKKRANKQKFLDKLKALGFTDEELAHF